MDRPFGINSFHWPILIRFLGYSITEPTKSICVGTKNLHNVSEIILFINWKLVINHNNL